MTDAKQNIPPEHYLQAVGDSVRKFRKSRKLSQEGLADLADLDRAHLGRVERGQRNVTLLNFLKIANALNIPPSAILASVESWIGKPEDYEAMLKP